VSRSEEPKRLAALNRCLVIRVTFKGSECDHVSNAAFNRDFSTKSSFIRHSVSSLFFKDHQNRSREQTEVGVLWRCYLSRCFFLDVFRNPIGTDNGTPWQSTRVKKTCAHYLNARHRCTHGKRNTAFTSGVF